MIPNVTVIAIIDFDKKPCAPLTKMMSERLNRFAIDLQNCLDLELKDDQTFNNLVIYMSYNSSYAVRWTIVSDVPGRIQNMVAQKCTSLGYIVWKDVDLFRFK